MSSTGKPLPSWTWKIWFWRMATRGMSLFDELERVGPLVAEEAGDAPEHAERFNRAGGFHAPHVFAFPAELVEDAGDGLLRGRIVAADEHGRPDAPEPGIDHAHAPDGIECLHQAQ